MKKKIIQIIVLTFYISIVYGQQDSIWINSWEKVIINDTHGGWSSFKNKYQILKNDYVLTPMNNPDSTIKKIERGLIDSLILTIRKDRYLKNDPLRMFQRDSTWLAKEAGNLWKRYLRDRKEAKDVNSLAISTLKDYSKIKNSVWLINGSHWTDDYPFVLVQIIKGNDTLSISSFGQYPYMLPWNIDGKNVYNSKVSEIISQMMPNIEKSNKSRLSGVDFEYHLIDKIYSRYLEQKINFIKARKKYSSEFLFLERTFEIRHAELSDMASIEWGGWFDKSCLELSLIDSSLPKQIQFSVIFGKHWVNHHSKKLVNNKDRLINTLENNPVYQYAVNCDSCLGEIHWVQSKSLSKEAKRNFLSDLKDNDFEKNIHRRDFKDAIFFELTENRNSKKSFSRWIFLRNGKIILWQLRGTFLMNLEDKFISNQGYICIEIEKEEMRKMYKKTMPNNG